MNSVLSSTARTFSALENNLKQFENQISNELDKQLYWLKFFFRMRIFITQNFHDEIEKFLWHALKDFGMDNNFENYEWFFVKHMKSISK